MPPNQAKPVLKRAAAGLLHSLGALSLLMRVRSSGAVVVLMYHRVLPADADTCSTPAICVTPQTFERHLRVLKRRFNPLSLSELMEALSGTGPLPPRACFVTFDDGWRDNFVHAYPIISDQGVPVTMFVATDFIGSHTCFWQERLTRLLLAAREHRCLAGRAIDQMRAEAIYAMDSGAARAAIVQAVRRLKGRPRIETEAATQEMLDRLAERGVDATYQGDDQFMSWTEVRTLCENAPIEIGSHMCSHTPMPLLPPERVRAELVESRRRIAAETGRAVQAIAYPNGDYTEQGLTLVPEAGYRVGFSVEPGYLRRGDNPFRVRRVNISEAGTDTEAGFLARLAGLF